MSDPTNHSAHGTTPPPDPVEDLLAECLARDEGEWPTAIAEACATHPQHATTLRRRFARLCETAEPLGAASLEVLPERLGEFRLLQRLGGGGMGVVYLAEQESLRRKVALKLVRPEHLYFQGARERFRREVEAAARCRHPGIVPVHAVGESAGIPFFAMEWVQGVSLGELLVACERRSPASLGPLDVAAALRARGHTGVPEADAAVRAYGATWIEFCLRVVRQAALALAHAHEQGVLHRDLKPSNLMLDVDGQVRLVDFGCSFAEGSHRLTRTGTELGSLPYMAPEQVRGEDADRRTDVYGLGVTLYELLTLRTPYLQPDTEATRRGILAGQARAPRVLNPALSWDAETVALVAMDREPARRYASMQDLAADLTRVLERRPIVARRPGSLLRARRFVQRHPTLSVAILLGTLLVVFGPLALWLQAKGHAAEYSAALTDVERLSDERVLADLLAEEEQLWPMLPSRLAGEHGMVAWIERAERLMQRSIVHERDLAALRSRALPRTPAEEQADAARARREEAEFQKLGERWKLVEADPSKWSWDAMQEVATAHRRLRFGRAERHTWNFAREGDRWRHDRLVALIDGIRELGVLEVRRVKERKARAESIERRTLVEPKELWTRTIAEVAADPLYRGLVLEPLIGFVPLGRDPGSKLFEFALLESGDLPKRHPRTGRLVPAPEHNTALVFVLLPGGKTKLASAFANEAASEQTTGPVEIELDPFLIAKTELNQAHWWNLFGATPSTTRVNMDFGSYLITYLHPVESISWRDAAKAAARLELALPTEAQWEYAARGGDDASVLRANLRDGDGWSSHSPGGTFEANGFGLYDCIGNVAEWCQDRSEEFQAPMRAGDGLRDGSGSTLRIVRGGSYLDPADREYLALRHAEHETNRLPWVGMRPVRILKGRS